VNYLNRFRRCAALAFFSLSFALAAFCQSAGTSSAPCPTTSGNNVCLTTFQGGNSRRGFNSAETALTQPAITATTGKQFHKQFSTPLNGAPYGQPLVLPSVVIGGKTYADVVYVGTEQDAVYAIDASTGKIIWKVSLIPAGYTYLDSTSDLNGCTTVLPGPVGITGTPVIDISQNTGANNTITSGTLYLVARTKTKTSPVTYVQTIYALDITSGATIASTVIGGTYSSASVSIAFDNTYSRNENQRGALLALPVTGQNPQIVITWAAHCDAFNFPYGGWVMAYQLNSTKTALTQTGMWVAVPSNTTYEGGIWEGASGPAADSGNHIYLSIGNGDANANASVPPTDAPTACAATPCDYGNSILRMALTGTPTNFTVQDFFTPFDWKSRNNTDYDLGSGGVMLLPYQPNGNPQNLLAQSGKEGSIYLLNTNPGSLGGYNGGNADQVTQYLSGATCYQITPKTECGIWGAPAFWATGGASTGYAYWGAKNLPLMAFQFYPNGAACTGGTTAGFCPTPSAQSVHKFGWPGPTPTVTAPTPGSAKAIVWLIDAANASGGGVANLWAFDGVSLSCLFSTDGSANPCSVVSTADRPVGSAVKFSVPSVANGKVFVGTTGGTTGGYLNIYGIN
jgi:hypothetical protein